MTLAEMTETTCLVTGASSGIGKATVALLRDKGVHVVAVTRTRDQANALEAEMNSGLVICESTDLSRPAEVIALTNRLNDTLLRLDLLVNGAAVQPWTRQETPDGLELTWATNVLAPMALGLELSQLLDAAEGEVLGISSMVHKWGKIHWDDLQFKQRYNPNAVYYQSKLALTLLASEAARRYPRVRFNTMHPGMTQTNFARDFRGFYKFMARLTRKSQRMPEEVAAEIFDIAFGSEYAGVTGKYFDKGTPTAPAKVARDEKSAARLWDICLEQLSPYRS